MTQFLPSPHTQVTLPTPYMEPENRVAALSAHTKDKSSFQPRCGPVAQAAAVPFPVAMSPPLSRGCLPSRLAGFLLNRARRRLWASVLRNWGMPSFALEQPQASWGAEPHPGSPGAPSLCPGLVPSSVQISQPLTHPPPQRH